MGRYLAGSEAGARARLRRLRRRLALVGRRAGRVLAVDLGPLRRALGDDPRARPCRRAACPAPAGSRAPPSTTRSTRCRCRAGRPATSSSSVGRRPGDRRISPPPSCATPSRAAGPASSASASGAATGWRRSCPTSRRRSSACMATASLGAVWSSCAPEFGTKAVVDRFAQIEPTVLLTIDGYRYGDRAIDRSAEVAEIRAAHPDPACHGRRPLPAAEAEAARRRPGRRALVPAPRRRGAARLRARPVRPSALRPVLVRHHRPPEADRPRPRRHPARAPQGARAAHGPRAGGPVLLVHDDRLDDVELPRVGARGRVERRAVRRQPRLARPVHAVAAGGRNRRHVPRRRRAVPHGLPGRRPRARARPRPRGAARRRLHGCAAAGGRVPVGGGARVGRDPPGVAERRHRPVHRVPRAVAARPGLGGRDQLPDARRAGRGVRPGRPVARRPAGRARHHRTDAVDAGRAVGRLRRLADARRLLRAVARGLAARRLADHHRSRLVPDHRTQRRDAQPRRRPPRDRGVLRGRRGAPGGRGQPRRPPRGPGRRPGRAAPVRRPARRRRRSTTTCGARSRTPSGTACHPATSRTPSTRSRRSRARCRARSSRCRSSGSCRACRPTRPRRRTRSPTRARSSRSRRWPPPDPRTRVDGLAAVPGRVEHASRASC